MEQTLGKRIAFQRKALGLTQDQLAEKLGVTAQAVSKWENDQSCPDIATIPRLADIFNITTDELLGVEPKQLTSTSPEPEPDSDHTFEIRIDDENKGKNFEFHYDAGRKGGIGIALWVILTAALLFQSSFRYDGFFTLWDCLWPSGLLVFGIFGLYPKFSLFRLGSALFGGYYVLNMVGGIMLKLNRDLVLPLFLLFFGLILLTDALNKKGNGHIILRKPGKANELTIDGETFRCETCFGEDHHRLSMSRLSGGRAEVSFGSLTVDLSGCEEISPSCTLDLEAAFGELTLLIPRGCKAQWNEKKAFADLDIKGSPAPDAATTLQLNCDVSFGQITLQYL